MVLIESDGLFFDKLKSLYDANKEKGSVWVTLKRVEAKPKEGQAAPAAADKAACLVRVESNLNKKKGGKKFSASIRTSKVKMYQQNLSKVVKSSVDGLTKPPKTAAELKAIAEKKKAEKARKKKAKEAEKKAKDEFKPPARA